MRAYGRYLIAEKVESTITLEEAGGIILPEGLKGIRYERAKIIDAPQELQVGDTVVPVRLNKGELILYDYAGGFDYLSPNGREYKMVRLDAVVAVLDAEDIRSNKVESVNVELKETENA